MFIKEIVLFSFLLGASTQADADDASPDSKGQITPEINERFFGVKDILGHVFHGHNPFHHHPFGGFENDFHQPFHPVQPIPTDNFLQPGSGFHQMPSFSQPPQFPLDSFNMGNNFMPMPNQNFNDGSIDNIPPQSHIPQTSQIIPSNQNIGFQNQNLGDQSGFQNGEPGNQIMTNQNSGNQMGFQNQGAGNQNMGIQNSGNQMGFQNQGLGNQITGIQNPGNQIGFQNQGSGNQMTGILNPGNQIGFQNQGSGNQIMGVQNPGNQIGIQNQGFGNQITGIQNPGNQMGTQNLGNSMGFQNQRPNTQNQNPGSQTGINNQGSNIQIGIQNPNNQMAFQNQAPDNQMGIQNQSPNPIGFQNQNPSNQTGIQNQRPGNQLGIQNERPGSQMGIQNQNFGNQSGFQNQNTDNGMGNQNLQSNGSHNPVAILGSPVVVPPSDDSGQIVFPDDSDSPSQTQCVQDCETSTEYDPVCGSNNITYFNPGRFVCARNCGIKEHTTLCAFEDACGATAEDGLGRQLGVFTPAIIRNETEKCLRKSQNIDVYSRRPRDWTATYH